MIQQVKEFLEALSKDEYISNVKALDSSITKEIYEEKYEIPFGKYFAKGGKTIPYEAVELVEEDGYTEEDLKEWQKAFHERFVFQIIEYKNPTLGQELQELFPDVKTVYRCMVSNDAQVAIPKKSIAHTYSVIETTNGLKIIYTEYIDRHSCKFITPNDWPPLHILDFGEIVAVESYVEPEEESSLRIYKENINASLKKPKISKNKVLEKLLELVGTYTSKIDDLSTLDEFYDFCLDFYFNNYLSRPIDIEIIEKDELIVEDLSAYNYPNDFLEWHQKYGNVYLWLESIRVFRTTDVKSVIDDSGSLLTLNNYLYITNDGGAIKYVYDTNITPPTIKYLDVTTTYEDINSLEELFENHYDFWVDEEAPLGYHNPNNLVIDEIVDVKGNFKTTSRYIQAYFAEELKAVPENTFLSFLKSKTKEGFKTIAQRYHKNSFSAEYTQNELDPQWEKHHNRAVGLKSILEYELAHREYDKALSIELNYNSYFNKGELFASMGNKTDALNYYNKSIVLNPNYALAYNNRAFLYYTEKKYNLALADIDIAIQLEADYDLALATKAEILFALDNKEAFYDYFEQAVNNGIDPRILDPEIFKKYGREKRYLEIISKDN